jgi:hypothetical protein
MNVAHASSPGNGLAGSGDSAAKTRNSGRVRQWSTPLTNRPVLAEQVSAEQARPHEPQLETSLESSDSQPLLAMVSQSS